MTKNALPATLSPVYDQGDGTFATSPAGGGGGGSDSWRIAAPFRLEVVRPMTAIYPLASAGTYAAHKWATTKDDYNVRLCWRGGEPPFRLQMTVSPTGAYLGTGGTEQTFTRTVDVVDPTKYRHSLPEKYAQVTLPAANITEGSTYNFTVVVTDQTDSTLTFTWSATAQDARFKWFDSSAGNNGNAGTFEAPYQTFAYGYTLASSSTYIYRYKPGTYTVSNNAGGGTAPFDGSHCKSHIGYGSGVIFDCSTAVFSSGTSDITIQNARIQGGPASSGNVRQIDLNAKSDRLHIRNVTFDTVIGTNGGDNPCGLMTWALTAGTYHEYISIVDCTLASTAQAEISVLFSPRYWLLENTTANGISIPTSNGALAFQAKHGCHTGTIRFCNFQGSAANGLIWISNQQPADCYDTEFIYNRLKSTNTNWTYICRFNGQVISGTKPDLQIAQRNSIEGAAYYAYTFENYVAGPMVQHGGTIWNTPSAQISDGGGGTALTTTSVKVANIDSISSSDLGVRGWVIASTLVE